VEWNSEYDEHSQQPFVYFILSTASVIEKSESLNNFYQEITIEGYPAYLFEGKSKADRTIIIWQNSTYHFEIASRFNKSELLKMAESIAINK